MLPSRLCSCIWCAVGLALALAFLALVPQPAHAAGPARKGPVSFINDVAPILKESCFGCHGAKSPKGKLDMTRYQSLRKGGTKDDPIVPGQPEDSYLIDVLTAPEKDRKRMPPREAGDALPSEKIALIERWIREGARLDPAVKPDADLLRELRLRWQPPAPPDVYTFPPTITALAFSPDGKKLVVGGNHELMVWDVAAARLEKRVRTRARRALALLFLPDGTLAVAGGRPGEEGDVRLYDLQGGTPRSENGVVYLDGVHDQGVMVRQLLDADDEVLCLALSPAGGKGGAPLRLASGGCDRLVHVWNLGAGSRYAQPEQSIENHADWVFGVAFAPDGQRLLTASRDKTAKVWDLAARESVVTFPDHQAGVYAVAVGADGKTGFSAGEDNQVRAWNLDGPSAGKQVRSSGGHGKALFKMLALPRQPLLATCSADRTVRLWNAANGAQVRVLAGHTDEVYALAGSPDGTLLASGSWNGEVKVWKVADGSVVRAFLATPGLHAQAASGPPKK
jgi:hypothetical protein